MPTQKPVPSVLNYAAARAGAASACLLIYAACAAFAADKYKPPVTVDAAEQEIQKGNIEVSVKVTGISTAQDAYDIFAPFDGRVEEVIAELFDMVEPKEAMARMVSTEMAALLDSSSAENKKQTAARWKSVYDYYDVKPEFKGIVTNIYVTPKTKVYKGDRLFTVAKKVVIVGKNTEQLYSPLAPGLTAELFYVKDNSLSLDAKLTNFMRLKDSQRFNRLWLEVAELKDGIKIGEQFDGTLLVGRSENTLLVPKKTLFELPGETSGRQYLIMEVETGLVSENQVEILKPGMHFINPAYFEIKKVEKEKPDGKAKKTD